MGIFISVNGPIIKSKEKEFICGIMEKNMKDNLKMIVSMEWVLVII